MENRIMRRISDMHCDFRMPYDCWRQMDYNFATRQQYREPAFDNWHMMLARAWQFGVRPASAGLDPDNDDISEDRYDRVMSEVVARYYRIAFCSIYFDWQAFDSRRQRMDFIRHTVGRYRSWNLPILAPGVPLGDEGTALVLVLEGSGIVRGMEDVCFLAEAGIRVLVPQYGHEPKAKVKNELADGMGLTPMGNVMIHELLERGVVIDLAHALPYTRGDILALAEYGGFTGQVIYSHGSFGEDMAAAGASEQQARERGISRDVAKRIIDLGGMIGLSVSRPFFAGVDAVVNRIIAICVLAGNYRQVAIGSDFGGVSPSYLIGIDNIYDFDKLAEALRERGLDEEAVRGITCDNAAVWLDSISTQFIL